MSSVTSTNTMAQPANHQQLDTSTLTLGSNNNKLIIENNASDVTISKCETATVPIIPSTSVPLKTQVLPLVVIQKHSKVPFINLNKPPISNNNIVQLTKLQPKKNNTAFTPMSAQTQTLNDQIFHTEPSPVFTMQNKINNIVASGSSTYVIKQVPKPSEGINTEKFISKRSFENMIVSKNGFLKAAKNKFVLAPMPNMPKITTNRLPVTATTNSVQPKLAILPMPVPSELPVTKQKVYNFQISDGKLQCADNSVTVMCDTFWKKKYQNKTCTDADSNRENNLVSDDSEKNDVANKTYELSITEESLSNHSEPKLIVSSVDSNCSNEQKFRSEPKQKEPLKFSHGVSILKKNYTSTFSEKRVDKSSINSNNNNTTSISDSTDISVIKPSTGVEETVTITIPPTNSVTKPERERRRKSQFSVRKDFDDMEITFLDEPTQNFAPVSDNSVVIKKEETVTESLSQSKNKYCGTDNKFDPQVYLKWEDGIGILPGTNIRFIINEFNILEYVSEEDYKKILEKKIEKREKNKVEQEEMCCLECGCYGIRSDFINPKFCSYDCQDASAAKLKKEVNKDVKLVKGKKKISKCKSETDIKSETIKQDNESCSEEDNNSNNEVSQDKFTYPWTCKKKGFSWPKYLDHIKAKAAPVKLFKDPFPYNRNGFRQGMKLEGVDPQHPSYFCVLTVAEVVAYRLRIHFDGYPDNYDFWCNADSMDIFPMGWCEKYGHVLHPPPSYTVDNFNWLQYLKVTKSTAAPKHLFANRAGQAICPNGFRIGMKLEAVDRKDTQYICVATVRDMMDNRILVHFDSWDDIYDYWADPTSPYIHPVGWCDQYGHNLTPPNDYPSPESFSWEIYLKETKAVAAPVRAFKQRPACGFKRGMRLECVDKRVPHIIRVATVDDVKEHQIRIHFDGWIDRYSYWVDDDSPDIHPMGWCQKTGHPIEPPLTPDDVYDFLECPTVGCRGQGHIQGPKYATHSTQKDCPYSEENVDTEKISPDRLLAPDKCPQSVIPVSRQPKECKIKPRMGRPPKYLKRFKTDSSDEPQEKKPKRDLKTRKESEAKSDITTRFEKIRTLIEQSKVLPAEKVAWEKHSHFLNTYISSADDPLTWTNDDVLDFVSSIPGCDNYTEVFKHENIDGESLLLLNQKDILGILNIKVGPAVKLYNSIVLLRDHFGDDKVFI